MIAKLWPIFVRDLVLLTRGAQGRGGAVLPLLFFLAVAMLFPFAVGPDARLLARTGAGVIWVAALLAAIQWALRGLAEEALLLIRIVAHWLSFGVPLMLAAPISAGLLSLDAQQLWTVEVGLLLGTPGLAAIGVTIAALTAGLRAGSALGGLLAIPLAVPLLIFGAGSLQPGGEGGLLLLGACSLVALAVAPFAGGAAIRAGRE
ncbi:MAG: heme exporter protein CcmB [Novosphingobium sp.]